jgi:UDP-N-acetyl-D-glucosamine dehydrogenase
LTWKAREYGHVTRFIELAGEINTSMPHYVIDRTAEALNEQGKPMKGSRILVVGLAYKADIDDVRESPSFELIELCKARGAQVDYYDPLVPATWAGRKHDLKMSSVAYDDKTIASYDCVLISTAHSKMDYSVIARNAKLCVDTRDAMRKFEHEMGSRLARA